MTSRADPKPAQVRVEREGDLDRIFVGGPIAAEMHASLFALMDRKLRKTCVFDFADVTWIDSSGTRSWLLFIRDFAADRKVTFENCTADVVMAIAMFPSFAASCKVRSAYARYCCDNCKRTESHLVDLATLEPATAELPERICGQCGTKMALDDDPASFAALAAGARAA
jgi:hypothetical protein